MGGLDLSAEQQAEMSKIREQFLPQMGALRGRIQANHEQLRTLRHGSAADLRNSVCGRGIAELSPTLVDFDAKPGG